MGPSGHSKRIPEPRASFHRGARVGRRCSSALSGPALLQGPRSGGVRATCWSFRRGEAAALFNSVRLFFLAPCFPVFPLQPAHCAVGYSSWVECFRLKCNFSAFKSLWRAFFFFFFPLKRTATPTRDNLMDYSAGLRGSP